MLTCQGNKIIEERKMQTISARFGSIRTGSGLSKRAFAETLGIHPMVAGDIELGKRDPSRDVLIRLARVYSVDITWLLTGIPTDTCCAADSREESTSSQFTVPIQLIQQEAAAGRGIEIDSYAETAIINVPTSFISPYRSERVRAVSVRGDSMVGAGLEDGDLVFFTIDDCEGSGIFVVSVDSALLVKRVQIDKGDRQVTLLSENPLYAPRVLTGSDLDGFKIEGRVLASLHRH